MANSMLYGQNCLHDVAITGNWKSWACTSFPMSDFMGQRHIITTRGREVDEDPVVYSFTVNGLTVRLIDTPSITGTNISDDFERLRKIFNRIKRSVRTLHSILIVSNSQDPDISPQQSIIQFLSSTLKGRFAVIRFGFTRTRFMSFNAGDVKRQIIEYIRSNDLDIQLDNNTVFTFDSEGFQFLAADGSPDQVKFSPATIEVFAESWSHSVMESERLINQLMQTTPLSIAKMQLTHKCFPTPFFGGRGILV